MIPFLTVDQVIERAIILITSHEKFRNANIVDANGNPIRITKARQFDGFDSNQDGLTISIYPYSYQGTSNETVRSQNAALVYEDFELGTGASVARERCRLALVVSLSTMGFEHEETPATTTGTIVFERSEKERALYKWLTIVWDILLTNPITNLGGLVHSSKVNWGAFHTTAWEKKENAVLHKATLLWNLEMYTIRNYKQFVNVIEMPDLSTSLSWTYVGVRRRDETPVYWDSLQNSLVTVLGFPLTLTPKNQRVNWNPTTQAFFDPVTGLNLTPVQLEDPSTSPVGPWIDTNLELVGVLMPSRRNLYWHKLLLRLQLADGTVINQLDDGTLITYDPGQQVIIDTTTGDPVSLLNGSFLSVKTGKVNIFTANGLELRDQFLF